MKPLVPATTVGATNSGNRNDCRRGEHREQVLDLRLASRSGSPYRQPPRGAPQRVASLHRHPDARDCPGTSSYALPDVIQTYRHRDVIRHPTGTQVCLQRVTLPKSDVISKPRHRDVIGRRTGTQIHLQRVTSTNLTSSASVIIVTSSDIAPVLKTVFSDILCQF